jgi:hypothetical protein
MHEFGDDQVRLLKLDIEGSEYNVLPTIVSKSAVSRRVVEGTRHALEELMSRLLDELELAALMIDGIELDERCNTRDGTKVTLGLWEGSTENAAVATALLADLQERGLDCSEGVLVVIDGAKALAKAVRLDLLADGLLGALVAARRHPRQHALKHDASERVLAANCS